jgi:hypothetical protein
MLLRKYQIQPSVPKYVDLSWIPITRLHALVPSISLIARAQLIVLTKALALDYPRWLLAPPAWRATMDHELIAIVSIFGLLHNSEIIRTFQNVRDPVPFSELHLLEVREFKLLTPLMPEWAAYLKLVLPSQAQLDRLETLMQKHGDLPWALSFDPSPCHCRTTTRQYTANGMTFTVVFDVTVSSAQIVYAISFPQLNINIKSTTKVTLLATFRTGLLRDRMKLPDEDYDRLLRLE